MVEVRYELNLPRRKNADGIDAAIQTGTKLATNKTKNKTESEGTRKVGVVETAV